MNWSTPGPEAKTAVSGQSSGFDQKQWTGLISDRRAQFEPGYLETTETRETGWGKHVHCRRGNHHHSILGASLTYIYLFLSDRFGLDH